MGWDEVSSWSRFPFYKEKRAIPATAAAKKGAKPTARAFAELLVAVADGAALGLVVAAAAAPVVVAAPVAAAPLAAAPVALESKVERRIVWVDDPSRTIAPGAEVTVTAAAEHNDADCALAVAASAALQLSTKHL